jgi:hypothetical protein
MCSVAQELIRPQINAAVENQSFTTQTQTQTQAIRNLFSQDINQSTAHHKYKLEYRKYIPIPDCIAGHTSLSSCSVRAVPMEVYRFQERKIAINVQ